MKPTAEHVFQKAAVLKWRLNETELFILASQVQYNGRDCGPLQLRFPLLRPARYSLKGFGRDSAPWLSVSVRSESADIRWDD